MSTKWMWVIVSVVGALLLMLPPPWMGAARAVEADVNGEETHIGGHGMNMRLVGYDDLQGRKAYHPTIVKQGNKYILYVAHHTGTMYNPVTKTMEANGTTILDVTNPQRPKFLKHLPSPYGPP